MAGVGWVFFDRWAAEGGLYLPVGLFRVAISPKSASHRPRQA